jgi:hypothetical protein
MNKKTFKETILTMWDDIDVSEAWTAYLESMDTIEFGTDRDIEVLEMLLTLDEGQRLLWRTALAEKGFEMTPLQVDQYISIVKLALCKE